MAKRSEKFARLSLDYADHPKIAGLSDAAFRAHVEMILYSRKYMTDGRISNRIAKRFENRFGCDALLELQTNDEANPSLKKLDDESYEIHGFVNMQETKAEIESRRLVNRENGRRGGRPKTKRKTDSETHSVSESPTENITEIKAEKEKEKEKEINNNVVSSAQAPEDMRTDVEQLLDELESAIEANGNRKPRRNKQARDAIRLLLDSDGYNQQQVSFIIRWSQQSEFWSANILSAVKLRKQFVQLVAQARRDSRKPMSRDEEAARTLDPNVTYLPAWA